MVRAPSQTRYRSLQRSPDLLARFGKGKRLGKTKEEKVRKEKEGEGRAGERKRRKVKPLPNKNSGYGLVTNTALMINKLKVNITGFHRDHTQ